MRTVLNVIWVVLGGFWLALGYFLAGVLACILIVTIPVGIASFRMARYVLWPFGKTVEPKPGAGAGSAIMNGIWFIIAGWWLAARVPSLPIATGGHGFAGRPDPPQEPAAPGTLRRWVLRPSWFQFPQ